MCGRASIEYTEFDLSKNFKNLKITSPIKENRNLCPTQSSLIILSENDSLIGLNAHFGLIPNWSDEFKMTLSTFNARSETVFESRLYGNLIKSKRCIFPVSGFYEWEKTPHGKTPHLIQFESEPIIYMAAVFSVWEKEKRFSFSILTTNASPVFSKVHDRMPVFLDQDGIKLWLNPLIKRKEEMSHLFQSNFDHKLSLKPVSKLINNPFQKSPEMLSKLA